MVSDTHMDTYSTCNVQRGEPAYTGKVTPGGVWVIYRFSAATDTLVQATRDTNSGIVDYGTAWTQRATLQYT